MELGGIIKFIKLTHDFQKVERALFIKGSKRMENDVEHSYQLAMVAWYAVSSFKLDLNVDKVIKYALLHDLVEVYAGDIDAFDPNPDVHAQKAENEHKALLRLEQEFAEFSEMTQLIHDYEARQDKESKFIYALDKIVAPINIYLDDGRTWKKKGITLNQLVENKISKVSEHTEVKKYFNQLIEILKQEKHLFDHSE